MLQTIYLKLLRYLQSKCNHPSYAVKADILEGDSKSFHIKWCEICGAWQRTAKAFNPDKENVSDWRGLRPDYYIRKELGQIVEV